MRMPASFGHHQQNIENNPMQSSGMANSAFPKIYFDTSGKSLAQWHPHPIGKTHQGLLG